MALRKAQRLRNARQFAAVFSGAHPRQHGGLTIRAVHGEPGASRFAVIVPPGTAQRAAARNTLRRRVSEILRMLTAQRTPNEGFNVVITVRQPLFKAGEIKEALVLLLEKSGILKQ